MFLTSHQFENIFRWHWCEGAWEDRRALAELSGELSTLGDVIAPGLFQWFPTARHCPALPLEEKAAPAELRGYKIIPVPLRSPHPAITGLSNTLCSLACAWATWDFYVSHTNTDRPSALVSEQSQVCVER